MSLPTLPMTVLTTARLALRHQTEADAPFVLALMTDPDWLRHIGDRGVWTVDDARAYIASGAVRSYAAYGFGLWLVERRADGAPVGLCGLLRRATLPVPDLGFAFARAHRRQGYAREAAQAVVAHARDALGVERLAAIVSPDNAPSIRLLEALGFTLEPDAGPIGTDDAILYGRKL